MIRPKKGYAEGWSDGRKSLTDAMMRTLDNMERSYIDNVFAWEEDDEFDAKAVDARTVIQDLRKILRMLS